MDKYHETSNENKYNNLNLIDNNNNNTFDNLNKINKSCDDDLHHCMEEGLMKSIPPFSRSKSQCNMESSSSNYKVDFEPNNEKIKQSKHKQKHKRKPKSGYKKLGNEALTSNDITYKYTGSDDDDIKNSNIELCNRVDKNSTVVPTV
jgi:hypothetical protein